MANVQLPNISHTNTDIDSASLSGLQSIVKSLMNTTAILTEELTYLLNNLDTRNVNEIDGDILVKGTVTAGKMIVDELSAISANLGKITAGEVYGAYISTSEGLFPRCEMSSTGNVFGAFSSAQHYIAIDPAYAGTPALQFFYGGLNLGRINNMSGAMDIVGIGGVTIYTGSDNLQIPSFGQVFGSSGENLGVELDSKASTGRSTGWSGDHNHGIPPGTVLRTADGGTVTFSSAPQHTHEQLA